MAQPVERSFFEWQRRAAGGNDVDSIAYAIVNCSLGSKLDRVEGNVEQRYVTSGLTAQEKTGPSGTGAYVQQLNAWAVS